MSYEDVVKEIIEQCFDDWCFNKEQKQYMGYFDGQGCLCILKKHFPEGAKNTEQTNQPDSGE